MLVLSILTSKYTIGQNWRQLSSVIQLLAPHLYSFIIVTVVILWDPTEKNQNDEFTCIRFYRPLNIVWLSDDGQLWLKLVAVSNKITRTVKRCVTEFINLSIVRCQRRALVSGVRYWHSIFCSEDGSSVFFRRDVHLAAGCTSRLRIQHC